MQTLKPNAARRVALLAGALLLWATPARAQVTVAPESLRVVITQGGEATHTLTIANAGAAVVPFCLDFDRPLQRSVNGQLGVNCGQPGELLIRRDTGPDFPLTRPKALTSMPDGRLFVSSSSDGRTSELDADLAHVRTFMHPVVTELAPFSTTVGITYNEDTGTLWWTNAEIQGPAIRRVMLLEGTLQGAPTGRRITLPGVGGGTSAPYPHGAAYDSATKRYYYTDPANGDMWAVDTLGAVISGYPLRPAPYPTGGIGHGPHVHGGSQGGPDGVRLELPMALPGDLRWTRVVVIDANGAGLGLETPVPALGLHQETNRGIAVRNGLVPNDVMYIAFGAGTGTSVVEGILGFRPVRLSPTWLTLSTWVGQIAPAGTAVVSINFSAGERAPGEYRATLVVEDTTGAVLDAVALTLVVTPDTPAEEGPTEQVRGRLAIAPNPARGAATVTLTLDAPARVRLALYDVLGREAALLHDGPVAAGASTYDVAPAGLPAGVYVVRVEWPAGVSTARLVVAR